MNFSIRTQAFNIIIFFVVVLLPIGFLGCHDTLRPVARKGVFDLRSWDFETDGEVDLVGDWAFYWESFLPPGENPDHYPPPSSFIHVPGRWNKMVIDGETISGIGYATYRLTIILPETAGKTFQPTLRIRDVKSAYTLFVNGHRTAGAGIPGTDIDSTVSDHHTQVVVSPVRGNRLELVIHVANFHHNRGGIWNSIALGSESKIRRIHEYSHIYDVFILGSIVMMGLYQITLWSLGRRDRAVLYFGIFCLMVAFQTLAACDRYGFAIASKVSWEVIHKIEYVSFYLGLPAFLLFIRSMFPTVFARWVGRLVTGIGVLFTVVVLFFPVRIYAWALGIFRAIIVVLGIYLIWVLVAAIRRKLDGARVVAVGFAFLFPVVVNDILYLSRMIYTGSAFLWGMLAFILVHSWLLARQATRLLITVEQQAIEQRRLHDELVEVHEKFTVSRLGTILGLAKLAEYRDEDTGFHLERIREYCRLLALALSEHPSYTDYITEEYIDDLYQSSILHDIGKVWVKDSVLLKPGRLTDEEFAHIREHTTKGGDILRDIERQVDTPSYLALGREIAYSHHEKWDGSGYPQGLKGSDIPLSARIVSLADVYDALTSKRPYKDAFSHERTVSIIHEGRGCHFNPDLVDIFLTLTDAFDRVRRRLHEAV